MSAAVLGAERYERSDGRLGHRNGYRPRLLTTQKDSGLIHSIVSTAANVHDLSRLPISCTAMSMLSTPMAATRASPKSLR